MKILVVKIKIAKANDAVRPMSITQAGTGNTITKITIIRPMAMTAVGFERSKKREVGMVPLSGDHRKDSIIEKIEANTGHVAERQEEHDDHSQNLGNEG